MHLIEDIRIKGSIAPSSKFLINKMISKISYDTDMDLLQLGFGKGVFTKSILKKISPKSTITIFEINKSCCEYKIEDSRIRYIEDSAENITKYCGDKKFDNIISTLPFASLPASITKRILKQIQVHLKCDGKFLQFQYSLFSRRDITKLFNINPKIDFALLNFPPAFIYEVKNINK